MERYSERKCVTFIPTGGAVEFPRKAWKSKVEKIGFLEVSTREMTTSKTVLGTL